MSNEAPPIATAPLSPTLERIVVITGDGRKFDLGKPGTIAFAVRRRVYIWKRRKEIHNG